MGIVLGIDPGLTGGLAFVDASEGSIRLVHACQIPTEGDAAQREVSPLMIDIIMQHQPRAAYIERAQAMPDQGASSGFNYGKGYGALRMAVRGCRVPLTTIESVKWKRHHALPAGSDKEHSRQIALHLFPNGSDFFERVMDHGPAEAALIAHYGVSLAGLQRRAA